jgi:hypothetical protein
LKGLRRLVIADDLAAPGTFINIYLPDTAESKDE